MELLGEEGGMFDSPLMDSYVTSTAGVSSNPWNSLLSLIASVTDCGNSGTVVSSAL